MRLFICITIALLARGAAAGPHGRNGGDVIVCGQPSQQSIELLDHYEARTLLGQSIQMGPTDLRYDLKVNLVIDRIARLNPSRAKLYRSFFTSFLSEAKFLVDSDLVPISDGGVSAIPQGCELIQIATQQIPELPGEMRYLIRQDLWNQLDNDGKAGLVLHEIILREVVNQVYPHQNSRYARILNGYVSSTAIESMTTQSLYQLLKSLHFESFDGPMGLQMSLVSKRGEVPAYDYELDSDGRVLDNCFQFYPNGSFKQNNCYQTRPRFLAVPTWRGNILPTNHFILYSFGLDGTLQKFETSTPLVVDLEWMSMVVDSRPERISIADTKDQGTLEMNAKLDHPNDIHLIYKDQNVFCHSVRIDTVWHQVTCDDKLVSAR